MPTTGVSCGDKHDHHPPSQGRGLNVGRDGETPRRLGVHLVLALHGCVHVHAQKKCVLQRLNEEFCLQIKDSKGFEDCDTVIVVLEISVNG